MAEMTTPTIGTIAAGAGATVLSTLGLDPATLFWALIGATVGLSFAPTMTRFRAVVVFVAVVLICSLFGAWLAQERGGGVLSRHGAACGLALFFHLLVSLAQTKLPALWDAVVVRWVGPGAEKP